MMTQNQYETLDLEAVRSRLKSARGQQFWRSLDELADTDGFRELVEREFPQGASELLDPVSRRTFLKMMGASLALAGVTGCTYQPRQYVAPFDRAPEGRIPGVPINYASTVTLGGYGTGVLVRSNEGRPTKIEGNPKHPASLGATDIFAQASILTMYDPDRSTQVIGAGLAKSWDEFLIALEIAMTSPKSTGGTGLHVLTETVTSPTLVAQMGELLKTFPNARWHHYEPINYDNAHLGARLAFGEDADTIYDFAKAKVIVSLDADFLSPGPGFLPYARAFSAGRVVSPEAAEMSRLYVVEPTPTATGTIADQRLPLRAAAVEALTRTLARDLGIEAAGAAEVPATAKAWLESVLKDLNAHPGETIVIAGIGQPPVVHALVHAINAKLGNVGTTVNYIAPVDAHTNTNTESLIDLIRDIENKQVEVLIILGGNPAFTAFGDRPMTDRLKAVPFSVHLSLYEDETSALTTWHLPQAHFLEAWSDARAYDGTASIVQPIIEPLYGGKTTHELIALLLGQKQTSYDLVRNYWRNNGGLSEFETGWQLALSQGLIAGSAAPVKTVSLELGNLPAYTPPATTPELVFLPDPTIWDGSFANNGWLQEAPKPVTKIVWKNAALVSPRTAQTLLGLTVSEKLTPADLEQLTKSNGRLVELKYGGGSLNVPIWITPGQADDVIAISLGYGRTRAGTVGTGTGVNAYLIRTSDAPWFGDTLTVTATAGQVDVVSTQEHWTMEGRDIVRHGTLEEYKKDPKVIEKDVNREKFGRDEIEHESLHTKKPFVLNSWGMTINLSACIGCGTCVVACQAENNIPVVGEDQVGRGREMQWIRIDRYYAGDNLDNPDIYVQPVTCMQCEQAPCELVCPVAATVHDAEGLNNMVYNRCVGTKYCSNNCPYKVRRFNFYLFANDTITTLQLMRNPDVTARTRGVMEKCTYCVQRISAARILAKRTVVETGQPYQIADGTIATACEAACPTQAITFGDLNDTTSRVAKLKDNPLNYGLLSELNTNPRTTYLARVRNPNAEPTQGEA